jgi:small subunit ribosomal protein S8
MFSEKWLIKVLFQVLEKQVGKNRYIMDSIGDFLTIIRNASKARKRIIEVEGSFVKNEITRILFEQGYYLNYKIENTSPSRTKIKIALKYDPIMVYLQLKKSEEFRHPSETISWKR